MSKIKDNILEEQKRNNIELDKQYQERPLTEEEIHHINYAVKEGYLSDDDGERYLINPTMAREYIKECDAYEGTHTDDYKD